LQGRRAKLVDIPSAIQRGFRAIIDAKGKLAEYFLYGKSMNYSAKDVIEALGNYSGLLRGEAVDQNS
jgi:hypothetical protein